MISLCGYSWLPLVRFLVRIYCICTVLDDTNCEGFNCLYLNTQERQGRVEDGGRWDDCGAINSTLAPNQQVAITINDKVHIVHSCIQYHCSLNSSLFIIHCTLGSDLDSIETPPPRRVGVRRGQKERNVQLYIFFIDIICTSQVRSQRSDIREKCSESEEKECLKFLMTLIPQNITQKYDFHCWWRTCLGRSLGKNVPYGRSNCNYANYCR